MVNGNVQQICEVFLAARQPEIWGRFCLPKISLRHSFWKMKYKMCSYIKRMNEQKFGLP
jgi:hypothetical protein